MRKLLSFLAALCCYVSLCAQTFTPPAYADIDHNYRNHVNHLFGQLEPARVPTGLLMDYAFDFSEPKIYNGTVLHDSTLMEPGLFSDLYKTIYTGQFTTSNLNMRHPAIHDSLWYIARQREVITLSGLLFRYNAFHPNALGNGTLQYSNGVWQNR